MFLCVMATEPISTSPLMTMLPARSLITTRAPVCGSMIGSASTWETNDTGSSRYCAGMRTSMLPWLMARASGTGCCVCSRIWLLISSATSSATWKSAWLLLQHQRDLAVLGEDVEEILFQAAAVVDAAGGGRGGVVQRDRAFGEGEDAGIPRVGPDQRRQEQPARRPGSWPSRSS